MWTIPTSNKKSLQKSSNLRYSSHSNVQEKVHGL